MKLNFYNLQNYSSTIRFLKKILYKEINNINNYKFI